MSTYQTSIPGAAGYAGAAALAQKAYANAMARLQQQRSQTLLKYGVKRTPSGSYQADPYNEYGSYQQMLRQQSGQVNQLGAQQASSGWGGSSGILGRQREALSFAQGGEQAALGQSLTGDLADLAQGEQQAGYEKDAALYQAQHEAALNAINNQQFNPGDYSNLPAVPYGPGVDPNATPPKRTAKPVKGKVKPAIHAKGKAKIIKAKAQKKKGRR